MNMSNQKKQKINVKAIIAAVAVIALIIGAVFAVKPMKDKTDAAANTSTMTEIETTEEQPADDSAWKNAYIEILRNVDREVSYAFDLGYVDNDDIPELFISEGEFHASGVDVYTYSDGKAVLLCNDGSFGYVNYIERKGFICGQYEGMGTRMCNVYKVKNGTAEKVYSTYDCSNNTEVETKRTINDKSVTEEEMQKFYDEFYGEKVSGFGGEDAVAYEPTEENYQKYITEFSN